MPYAIAADYAAFLGIADTYSDAERLRINAGLLSAEDDIRNATRYARFDETTPEISEAFTRATCSRFAYVEETGDPTGAALLFQSVKIGTVSLSRSDRDGMGQDPGRIELDARTKTILANALGAQIAGHW